MKSIKSLFVLASLLVFTTQCEIINDDLLTDPNQLSPASVDPDFLLNSIQLEARNVYRTAASVGGEMTRMYYMFGSTYQNAFAPTSFNGIYDNAYSDLFADSRNLVAITDVSGFTAHSGMARTLEAYALIALVDMFGDMPFSEALDASNFNPGLDDGSTIYDAAIALLDQAVADFENARANNISLPANDFYYGDVSGNANRLDAWVSAANTIKLKAYLNTGNTAGVNALLANATDTLIVSAAQDFTFNYSSVDVNPDSRHPDYSGNYIDNTGAGDYMSIGYMNMLLNDKADKDPRIHYYFFRQVTDDPTDINENTCLASFPPNHFDLDDPFCTIGDGWWGRDHLINDGIPPDGEKRTTWGVYPAGGLFDQGAGGSADRGDGEGGAGIDPILMSAYTHFMIAEAQLTLNNDAATAQTFLESAIDESFGTIAAFGDDQAGGTPFEITQASIDNYKAGVVATYTAANNTDKLRTIIREYYLALFPNGYEAYNAMRRTGFPDRDDNLQPAREPNPGTWYRSVLYPSDMVERNSNVDQKSTADLAVGPFWDTSTTTKFDF